MKTPSHLTRGDCRLLATTIALCLLAACVSDKYLEVQAEAEKIYSERTHLVKKGDTLFSIAWANNMDYRRLAALNGIVHPHLIHPGQELSLGVSAKNGAETAVIAVGEATAAKQIPSAIKEPSKKQNSEKITDAKIKKQKAKASESRTANKGIPATKNLPVGKKKKTRRESVVAFRHGIAWSWPANGAPLSKFDSSKNKNGIKIGGGGGDIVRAAAAGRVVYSGGGLRHYGPLILIKHNADYFSAYGMSKELLVKEGAVVKAGDAIAKMGKDDKNQQWFYFEVRYLGNPLNPMTILPRPGKIS